MPERYDCASLCMICVRRDGEMGLRSSSEIVSDKGNQRDRREKEEVRKGAEGRGVCSPQRGISKINS